MMDYTAEIVELYSHTKYLEPKQFQVNIMNKILNNIEQGKKMQAIKMPNGTGKTVMCNFLAILLSRRGYKVVIFNPWEASRNPKTKNDKFRSAYLQPEIYDEDFRKEHSGIACVGYKALELLDRDDVDVFLTDALGSVLEQSVDVLADLQRWLLSRLLIKVLGLKKKTISGVWKKCYNLVSVLIAGINCPKSQKDFLLLQNILYMSRLH